jgi:Zn-finger in ubiquitin-hydrolases and other protein
MIESFSLIANIPSTYDEVQSNQQIIESILDDQTEEPSKSATASNDVKDGRSGFAKRCIPIVSCDSIHLSLSQTKSFEHSSTRLVAVFCPSTLVDTALEQTQEQKHVRHDDNAPSEKQLQFPIIEWLDNPSKLSHVLLSLIHPFLSQNLTIRAILTYQNNNRHPILLNKQNSPGDVLILDLSHCPYALIVEELLNSTNCEVIRSGPDAILQVLLLSRLEFCPLEVVSNFMTPVTTNIDSKESNEPFIEIPACAVCLFRIDPTRLGLPRPRNHQLCSKFCSPPTFYSDNDRKTLTCPRQRLLLPWPLPNHCTACHIIRNYWRKNSDELYKPVGYGERDDDFMLFCSLCGMQETLWVCLTCAFVGCGRYSNKHAAEHNDATHHPFCLELSTLRIWSYVDSEYIHRIDLLECPESLQNLHQLPRVVQSRRSTTQLRTFSSVPFANDDDTQRSASYDILNLHDSEDVHQKHSTLLTSHTSNFGFPSRDQSNHYERMVVSSFASVDEKTPKKATLIGEEYEVLLQSALEDQAQFYEGEITSLRATLAGTNSYT